MLSLVQAASLRGSAGQPLPGMYAPLQRREAFINRAQLSLIVGPPSAGKSLFIMNYMARAGVPALGFFLDTDQLTAAARFGAILTKDRFFTVKEDIDRYAGALSRLENMQAVFHADDLEDIQLQIQAFEQRYGVYPSLVVVDNLGNLTSSMGDEWALLKALTLELDKMAREYQCAILAAHHTTDLQSCEPAQRTAILGKVAQYPRLIFSIGFNPDTTEYKVAVVKNSSGPSDPQATNPVVMYADTARMQLTEENPRWSPSSSLTPSVASRGWSDI